MVANGARDLPVAADTAAALGGLDSSPDQRILPKQQVFNPQHGGILRPNTKFGGPAGSNGERSVLAVPSWLDTTRG